MKKHKFNAPFLTDNHHSCNSWHILTGSNHLSLTLQFFSGDTVKIKESNGGGGESILKFFFFCLNVHDFIDTGEKY